jgi:hypothetical protein
MNFGPDIIVAEPGVPRISVVVEARLRFEDFAAAESHLREYMVKIASPLGLLISPRHISIYRNLYSSYGNDAIQLLGPFEMPAGWLQSIGAQQLSADDSVTSRGQDAFEQAVQRWLEQLGSYGSVDVLKGFSPEAVEALSDNVLPAVATGVVRAARPLFLRAG